MQVSSMDSLTEDQSEEPKTRARRANQARHARKCTVCHHKDREFIDQDYLRWLSPKKIAREYTISHQSVVYRHADATGLRAQRRASLRATLENFIEQAESVRATAGSVVAAVRLYAQINDQGQWTPPAKRYIVEHRYTSATEAASASAPVHKKDGSPSVATFAHSSQAKNDPENSQERSSKGAPAPGGPSSSPLNAAGSQAATSDAHSAAPLGASPDKFGAVPQTTGGSPPDRLSPLSSNAAGSQAATSAAQSAEPTSVSPEKFSAVPVATINLAPDLPISNREHVELEPVATR